LTSTMLVRPLLLACGLAVFLTACSAKRELRREFGPWTTAETNGLRIPLPANYVAVQQGSLTIYQPAPGRETLPWLGVSWLPKTEEPMSPKDMLARVRPRNPPEKLKITEVAARIAGVKVPGFETADDQVHGWIYVLSRDKQARGALMIATPARWGKARAEAYQSLVVSGVEFIGDDPQ